MCSQVSQMSHASAWSSSFTFFSHIGQSMLSPSLSQVSSSREVFKSDNECTGPGEGT